MPPQGLGMVGALPRPAWGAVLGLLSSRGALPVAEWAWRTTVLELRRTCKALAELVGAGCVAGAGRLQVYTADEVEQLEAAVTAVLGRALVVHVGLPFPPEFEVLQALARTLTLLVERGHMISFSAPSYECTPTLARMIEAALIEASRKGLLLLANFREGEEWGWSVDAMAQLSVVALLEQERETIATLVGAGALQRIVLQDVEWADMSMLSSLRKVKLDYCAIEDLSPLADVCSLVIRECHRIKALPAMRNDVLSVDVCRSLTDVSGLAAGRVGHLELGVLKGVEDVSAIGAMQPPPRTVILHGMRNVQDVSMLAGIHRLELNSCKGLDKATTLAALDGKVGTIVWDFKTFSARTATVVGRVGVNHCLVS